MKKRKQMQRKSKTARISSELFWKTCSECGAETTLLGDVIREGMKLKHVRCNKCGHESFWEPFATWESWG